MATTEVESAEAIPLTTMQKMEVDDKELLRAEYDQSVDQLSKDEQTKIKVELTKAFETVEQDCEAEEISVPENQAEVLEEHKSTPVAPYKEYLEVSEVSEELQEMKGANTMDVLSASKTENDDAVREKAFEDSIEHEVPNKVLQPENSVHIQAEDSKTEKTTTDSVQVEEQIIKNICKVEDETGQAISLKDDPVVENLESPSHIIPEKIEEAETSDIAEKTIPDVEEENTINEQHTAVVEGGASNLEFVELEKAQEADTPHSNIVKDEKMERADTVQVTEEPREVEGIRVIADSSEGDIPPMESFTREVNEQSYEKKNDEEPSPTSNIERTLEEEENKCEKREAIIEEVNDEPASTSIDDRVEEQTNIVGHLSTNSQEEEVTTVSLKDKKEDSSKKEINEQFTTGLSENKEVPEKSASLNDKPGVGVPESSLNSSSEKPEKVIASDDSIKISTTEEEADKIEEQGTDTITVTDKDTEKADAVQVIEEPRDVKGIHSTADSSEVDIPPARSFNSEVIEKTCEEEKEDPTPTSNIEQLLQEEKNKSEKREAINEEVNDEQTSDINYDSVKEDANIAGHEKDLVTESHEDDVTAVSLDDEKEASNKKETSDQVITEILEIKEEPEKSTSQNDEPELGVPKTESSSNSTSEKPEEVASENVDAIIITRTEELADKIDEQGSNTTGYNKASDTESAREMNFTLQEANENTGVAEAKILDKDAEVKEILSTDEIPTETHKGVTDDAGKLKLLEEEKDEISAISKIVDRTPEENIDERETGHLTSEEVVELENPYDIDLKETCEIEDAETNKEESVEISENDDRHDSSLTVTADDSSSELLLPVEINQKKTSQDEKDDEQPEQIDETPEIVEKVLVLTTAEIKEDVPGKDEDISASLSVEEPVEEVEHIVETDKEDTTREDEIQSAAEELTVVSQGDATIDVSDATDEVVTKSVEGKSIDTTVEESVVEDGSKLDELIVSESPIETHGTEEVSAQVDDTGETASLDHMENKVETSLEVVSGSYPGDFDNLKVSKPDPAQIDETPEIVVQVPVETPAPAEIKEDAPGKDEDKHVSLREEELVEKVEQIVETDKDDTTRECEIEGVPERQAVVSRGDTSFIVADGAEVVTDSVQGKSIDDTVNESAVEDATKLDELVVSESRIQTFRTEEVSPVVEEIEGTTSLDQMKNKVETSLGVISEPDPDDSENLEKVLERDPADSEKLKQVSEPDPDDSEKLKQVSEPDPDDSKKLKQVSEPNPDDSEKLKQVSEPDPDDSENLEKVLELTQVSELDLDESENLINISEPNPDESEILKNVSEPVPDETNILEKFSEPDPDDSENLKNASEPDPDSVNTEGTELPTSSVNDENISGLKSKNDKEEIVEDQQKHDVSVENKEAATEVLEPEDEQEVKKNSPNETEDTDLFTSSVKHEEGKENDKLKEDEYVEEALTAEEMAVQKDEQLQPDRFPNKSKDNELSASNLNDEDTTILKKGTEEVQDELSVENQPEDDDSARESEISKEVIVQQDEQGDDDTNILEKFLEPDPDDSENQDKDDKTEIPKECDELTNKEFSVDTSEAVLEKTDEQPREITVPDKVSAASVEEETVIGSIEVIKCMDTAPELSVEDSVQEEDISSQIPEIKTEEDSEPTAKVNSQTIQERECDVEHVEESGSYETVGIVQQDDANIESQTSKGSEEVITREIEGAEGLSPPTDASVEDDGHVGGKILLSEVLVQPNDNQGEEIEHLPSKTVNTELAASSVNDESITGLTSEEHKNEVLEERLKDYASAENKEPATKGLEPEDQQEVNESVPNETEDAELFTSSVNEKEKDQPKEEESVEENLTADEEAVQEDEQVPLDQFPNESKDNEPYASNLNDDDTTILTCEKGPVEEVQEELPGENQPEDSENVTGSEISNEAIVKQDKQAHVGQILDGTGNLEPSVSYASDEKQASLKSEEVLDPVEEQSKNDQKEVHDLEQKEIVHRELVLEVDQGEDENNEPDPDDTDILEKFSEPDPDDRANLKNVSEPDPDDYDNKDKVDKTEIPDECDEVTTKEIPAGTNGEVLEKTDEQHRETTVPDEVNIVSRNIEVKPATDTATELSVKDSVQEEDSSSQIPEIKTEKESEPMAKVNSQTTQDPESDVEHVEESGNYETVSIVQQDYAFIEIQASEASEKVITRVIEGAEGLSPSTDVLVEDSKPNEASKDSVNKEQEIENVSQVLVQPDDNQGEEIDHLPSKIEVIELATSSVSNENISGLKSEEDKKEILEEQQKDDDIADNKEAAREQEVNKNVTNETEDDGKEKDKPKDKENVEEQPTADEVALQEDEQAQPDRIPNELKDNELSGSNLNDEDTTIIKCEKCPEKAQEKQGEESVHFPTEAEGTETPASCVYSGNLIKLRDEDTQEENNEKDQAKENETIQEIETATEVIVLEDKQGEQLKHLQSEDQEAETSAPGVIDDEIDIPKNEAGTEIVLEIDQAKDEDAKEIETTTEVFELENKAVELEHLPTKSREAEPSSEDERNTVLKSEEEPEEILHEEKNTNLAKDDIEEKENEKETLGQVSDETGNLEPSVSYASDEKHASLKSVQVPEETLEDESKNYQTEVDEIEKKEIANRVIELEDVQGKDAKNEPSASLGNDDSIINTLKSEESPEDVQEQKETKGAKNDGEKKRSETANEALLQRITIGKEIDLSNKIVEPEPNASTDEILILRGEEEIDGPEQEEHVKDQVSDDKITANELSIEEDKKGDELEHLAKETEETDAEESKQRSKEIKDVIKEKDHSNEDLGSSFEELKADSQESKNNLDKEPDIVEDSKKKEDSATESGSYEGTLEDGVENENTKTVDEEAASTDETELTKQLLETSVVKDDENVTIPEALPEPEDKSSEEDGKGLTETHEVNMLESLASVEVWNSEVQNDFVETAKETKGETLESIIPVAGEEDKKDLIIVETQGEKLHGLERNDVLIQGYESQNASEFRKTNSDEKSLQTLETVDVPTPAAYGQVDVTLEDAKEIETTTEVFELESKAVELEHLPTKSREAEPSSEDERNTVLKREDEPEEILHEEKKTNLAKDDIEEKENENETLGHVSDVTGNLEPPVSYASDEKHASLKSVQVPEETLEDESKNYQTEVDEIEKREIANSVLELEDVQGKDAKNEPSASPGNDDSIINTLKSEESPEDVQEQKETKGAKNDGEKKRSETANEALLQRITIGKEIDLSNKIVEPEPNASTDEILILRGEEETDGPEEEEHVKDQVSDAKITANELLIEEDKKGDELEHLAKETDAEESKQRSKEIEDVIKEKDPSYEDLGSSFEELEADSQESKHNLDKEPEIVEDSKKKEDSATEGGSYEGTLEDRVVTSILQNENTKTVDEEAASTDETELTKQLLETSVVKDVDENVTIPEALPAAEDKSSEEDGKGLTETHEVNKLESLASVEVWNSEVQNDFVETAKETKGETLESIIPVAGEEDKKELIIVETQGEKLHGLERNDVFIQGYESQNASEFRKTNSDEKSLQTLETVDVPTPAADGQVDVTLEETADYVPPESPVLQGANTSSNEDQKELTRSETGNDEHKEQKGQEKYKEDITSATHEAVPEGDEENKTEEQLDDSSSETVIEPVKLQDLEANNALVREGKNEKVAHIELGKEETQGESETKTETLSDFSEEVDAKEVQFNDTPTVSLSPTDDKPEIDKFIKTEVSDEVADKTKVSSESPQVSNREIYAREGQQVNEAQTEELTKEVPEDKLEEIKETGVIQDDGIKDLNTAGIKGYKVEEHNLNELDGSKTTDATIKVKLMNRDSMQVVNTPSEQFDVSGIPQISAVQRELVKNTHAEATPKDDPAPVSSEAQQSTSKSLDYGEEVQPENDKKTESHTSLIIPAENSLSDLLQISTKDTIQMTQKPNQETNPTLKKEDVQTEDPKTDEDKDDEDDGDGEEQKKTDSSSDGVIVEASRDMDVKSPQKKHHGILSGVGTKVKNSISKVKKAITGKSSHPKPPSPK